MDTLRWGLQGLRCIALLSLLYVCVVTAILSRWFCDSILVLWVDIADWSPAGLLTCDGGGANATTVEEVVLLPMWVEGDSAGSW